MQLPRNTKCIISGCVKGRLAGPWSSAVDCDLRVNNQWCRNARTKPELVGLEVYIKKAVGLGGWHWLGKPETLTAMFDLVPSP